MDSNALILLVDENVDEALQIQDRLRRNGISNPFYVLQSPNHAIDFLGSQRAPTPSFVLISLKGEASAGFPLLRSIRERGRNGSLITILMVESGQSHELERALNFGVNGYHLKDQDFAELAETIRTLDCADSLSENERFESNMSPLEENTAWN